MAALNGLLYIEQQWFKTSDRDQRHCSVAGFHIYFYEN